MNSQAMQGSVGLLTKVREERLREFFAGKTVAIVGNAETATRFENGALIDSHDIVVRFNTYQTDGYEKFAGGKTDVIAIGLNPSNASFVGDWRGRRNSTVLVTYPNDSDSCEISSDWIPRDKLLALPSGYNHELVTQMGCSPTTGITIVSYLIDKCKTASIFLTGFSFEKLARSHYSDDLPFDYQNHCPIKDKILFARKYDPSYIQVDDHIRKILTTGQPSFEVRELRNRNGQDYSAPHRAVYQEVCRHVRNKTVLEVGGGIGYGVKKMLAAHAAEIVTIEPEPESAAYLRNQFPDLELHHGTLENTPIDRHFDLVTCVEVLEHLPPMDVHRFLVKASKLAPKLMLSTPDRTRCSHGRFSKLEMQCVLKAAGFSEIRIQDIQGAALYSATSSSEMILKTHADLMLA